MLSLQFLTTLNKLYIHKYIHTTTRPENTLPPSMVVHHLVQHLLSGLSCHLFPFDWFFRSSNVKIITLEKFKLWVRYNHWQREELFLNNPVDFWWSSNKGVTNWWHFMPLKVKTFLPCFKCKYIYDINVASAIEFRDPSLFSNFFIGI